MDLQEFIRSVLVQVVRGVENAQRDLKDSRATINPEGIAAQIALEQGKEAPNFGSVEFEVAVEVENQSEQSDGVGIQVAVFKMGVDGKKLGIESHVGRSRFGIPVHLPPGDVIKGL